LIAKSEQAGEKLVEKDSLISLEMLNSGGTWWNHFAGDFLRFSFNHRKKRSTGHFGGPQL
jgi:hypothetical protein